MRRRANRGDLRHLFYMPSAYGFILWNAWLVLYWLKLIPLDDTEPESNLLYLAVAAAFLCSAAVSARSYKTLDTRRRASEDASAPWPRTAWISLLGLHALGAAGIVLYVRDFASHLGGLNGFILTLANEPYKIRWESELTSSTGTQVSYAGWLAIALTVIGVQRGGLRRRWWALAAVQFSGNLLFLDRTRPTWILFTALVALLPGTRIAGRRLAVRLAGGLAGAVLVFLLLGSWIGKVNVDHQEFRSSSLPPALESLYIYGVSGFAYFNRILSTEHNQEYLPLRTAYPLFKALAAVGLSKPPPSQILEFLSIPMDTNVGTFLEPFFRDGGLPYLIFGILFYSFGLDWLARGLWRRGTPLCDFAAANLCFASFIGFFTPKIGDTPLWIFCGLALMQTLLFPLRRTASKGARIAPVV